MYDYFKLILIKTLIVNYRKYCLNVFPFRAEKKIHMKAKCEFVLIIKKKKIYCKPTNWKTLAKIYFKRKLKLGLT